MRVAFSPKVQAGELKKTRATKFTACSFTTTVLIKLALIEPNSAPI